MRILKALGFWTVAVLAILMAAMSMRFLTFDATALDEFLRPNLLDHPIPFYIHTTLGPLVLILGIVQFLPVTRRGWYHRAAGRVYVAGVLIAAITGFVVSFTTAAGLLTGTGFTILAVLWFGATLMAYIKVRQRDFAAHRRWMIRSYALTCGAITLRIIVPVSLASGLDFQTGYLIAAWGSWMINIPIAEMIIQYGRKPLITAPRNRPQPAIAA